jgi:nitrogenase molybdenum-iron protein alpha chain
MSIGLPGDEGQAGHQRLRFQLRRLQGRQPVAGHHIANNHFQARGGLDDTVKEGNYRINLLGEYNIGGDAFEIDGCSKMRHHPGFHLQRQLQHRQLRRAHTADLNLIMCHRSINYVAEMMETKYGVPWIKVNFIGAAATAKSLRKIALFRRPGAHRSVEEVIAEEMPRSEAACAEVRPRTEGKRPCFSWAAPGPTTTRNCSASWA